MFIFIDSLNTWLYLKACVLLMYYWVENHPKLHGAEWPFFSYVRGFWGLGIWKGPVEVSMSVFYVSDLTCEVNPQLEAGIIWSLFFTSPVFNGGFCLGPSKGRLAETLTWGFFIGFFVFPHCLVTEFKSTHTKRTRWKLYHLLRT